MGIAKKVQSTENVFIALLTIGLIGIVFLIVFGNLQGNLGFGDSSNLIGNETAGAGAIGGYNFNGTNEIIVSGASNATFQSISNVILYNFSLNDGTLLPAGNFTVNTTAGGIVGVGTYPGWDNVSVTYTLNFRSSIGVDSDSVIQNLSGGAVAFFGFANVWFVLLAVVLLIVIVMSVVRVAKSVGGSSSSNRSDTGGSFAS